jgi:hypothetical protein
LNAVLLAREQSLPILNVLGLTRLARAGLELTTSWMLSKTRDLHYTVFYDLDTGNLSSYILVPPNNI